MPVSERIREFAQYSEIKQLAFRIKSLQAQKRFQSLAVLSYFAGEGKTLLCAALALAYADISRNQVCIIDTTTRYIEGSLRLPECLVATERRVAIMTMEDLRTGKANIAREGPAAAGKSPVVHSPEVVSGIPPQAVDGRAPDATLFRAMSEEGKTHGLVLIDTVSLNSKNRGNVDPLGIARQSDAAILVVSRKLLNSSEVEQCMTIVRDHELHLMGVVANEEFAS